MPITERLKNWRHELPSLSDKIVGGDHLPIVTVSPVTDELLSAIGKLTVEYGKIGATLIGSPRAPQRIRNAPNTLSVSVRAAISESLPVFEV